MFKRLTIIAGVWLLGCDEDAGTKCKKTVDAAVCVRDTDDDDGGGGEANASCVRDIPCVNDTQCVSVAGASCNTRTSKCQIVKCGAERAACSIDGHCKSGHRCDNGACKYDPTPRCYSESGGYCVEGFTSSTPMEDCTESGGESVSSCPAGHDGVCRYEQDGQEIVARAYTSSANSELRSQCPFLEGEYTTD